MKKNIFWLTFLLFFLIFSLKAQQNDTIKYPDTSFYKFNIYKINDGKSSKWGFYGKDSTELSATDFDSIVYRFRAGINLSFYEVWASGKCGFLKPDRSVWIPLEYSKLDYEQDMNPHRIFAEKSGKFGILNVDGSNWLEPVYDEILTNGTEFKVRKDSKWGILGKDGKEIIPVCFDKIFEHKVPEMSLVQNDTEQFWSIFLWSQNSENPCKAADQFLYEKIEYFNEYFTVFKDKKWGLADKKGNLVLKMEYEELKPFVFNYLRTLKTKINGKYGLMRIDSVGQTTIMAEIKYDDIGIDDECYKIKVASGKKRDYLYEGEPYFGLIYEDVKYFNPYRIFSFKKGKKWGLARENKEVFIEATYDKIMFIDAKNYLVQKSGKWGIINERNQEIIPIMFNEIDYRPENGFFFAAKGKKWGVVSLKSGVVLPPKYDDVTVLPNKTFLVEEKGMIGIVGVGSKPIVPLNYITYSYKPGDTIIQLKDASGKIFKYKLTR